MSNTSTSIIRTLVPLVAGWIITWLVAKGFSIDQGALENVLYGLFSGLYYIVVRFVELKWPAFGVLLGVAQQPSYEGTHAAS